MYLQKGRILDQYRNLNTFFLRKKDDRDDSRNYSPICLLNGLRKLLRILFLHVYQGHWVKPYLWSRLDSARVQLHGSHSDRATLIQFLPKNFDKNKERRHLTPYGMRHTFYICGVIGQFEYVLGDTVTCGAQTMDKSVLLKTTWPERDIWTRNLESGRFYSRHFLQLHFTRLHMTDIPLSKRTNPRPVHESEYILFYAGRAIEVFRTTVVPTSWMSSASCYEYYSCTNIKYTG